MPRNTTEAVAVSDAANSAVSVGTTATLLTANKDSRVSVAVVNNGAATVYWGATSAVTTTTGIPLAANASFEERDYTGAIYGIVAAGAVDCRVWDVG